MALTVWLVLAAAWVIFIIPVLMLRRRVDRHAWPAWTTTLHGDVGAHFAYLRDLFEGNAELARDMAMLAKRHRARGAEAARARLTGALDLLETLSQSVRGRLDEWLVVCRAALALYPLPRLPTLPIVSGRCARWHACTPWPIWRRSRRASAFDCACASSTGGSGSWEPRHDARRVGFRRTGLSPRLHGGRHPHSRTTSAR